MTVTSRAPEVLDRLVELATAAAPDRKVADGPDLDESTDLDMLCIGWDGDDESDTDAVSVAQEWAGLGAKAKDETLIITCAAISRRGNGSIKAVRDAAYASLFSLGGVLRDDPSMGFTSPTIADLRTGDLRQRQTGDGPEVRILFQIGVQTRI